MSDGTRTRGRRDHNPELYQLSYAHQAEGSLAALLGSVASKLLALTFDDGPDPRGTPAVLEALEQAEVTATFFVLAERVEQHPELLERVVLAGHDVQIHGYEHLRHPYTPREDVENDIDRALSVVPATKWRIPWGHLAPYTQEVARERGLTIVGWDADTHDWRGDSAEAMLAQLRLEPGGIVLAHDGVGAGARQGDGDRDGAARAAARANEPANEGSNRGRSTTPWPTPLPLGNPNFAA